jgi:hypothetical protein
MYPTLRPLTALLLLAATPVLSQAEQFVLFDQTFTFTKADADNSKPSPSHLYVKAEMLNPQRPKDWTAPVDYRNGTVHVRLEVLEKPAGSEAAQWSVCFIPYKGLKQGYGCFNTDVYKEKGVYEKDVSMTKFWHNEDLQWDQGIREMHLVLKDATGAKGHTRQDPERFFPTKVRFTVTQVSAGAKYDPSAMLKGK